VVNRVIYELKTVETFARDHEAQAIHYAALTGTDRVKLINFRSPRVDGRLLRSPLYNIDRRAIVVNRSRWARLSESCDTITDRMIDLLHDWGAFLDSGLYQEALVHFAGGESECLRRLPVLRDGLRLGTHAMPCHSPEVGFLVTAFREETEAYEAQLCRLLRCLPLLGLQWFNLKHAELQAVSLLKDKGMETKE
jgi:PD-(D/E)XK nuclease superfamily protein